MVQKIPEKFLEKKIFFLDSGGLKTCFKRNLQKKNFLRFFGGVHKKIRGAFSLCFQNGRFQLGVAEGHPRPWLKSTTDPRCSFLGRGQNVKKWPKKGGFWGVGVRGGVRPQIFFRNKLWDQIDPNFPI